MSYINLHTHTDYSNIRMLDSINQLSQVFNRCKELGMPGVAITDHETVSAHIKAIQYVSNMRSKFKKKYEEENDKIKKEAIKTELDYWNNFKLILGNEIYLVRNNLDKENYIKDKDKYYHFILLAKDEEGHKQIRELSSRAWKRSFRQFIERVPTYYSDIEEVVGANPGHLVASTACLGSAFAKLIKDYLDNGHKKEYVERIDSFVNWAIEIFGKDNFFIELQPSNSEDQHIYNKCALAYAKARNLRAIITTDAHYIRKEDREIHKAYLNAGEGDREVDAFYSGTYLMGSDEIKEFITNVQEEDIDTMLNNTLEIGKEIQDYNLYHQEIVPKVKIETLSFDNDFKELIVNKEYINNFVNSNNEQNTYYINSILKGLKNKIEKNKWQEYIDRIELEVAEVWEITKKIGNELSSYFNSIAKVVEIMWNEGDSYVGAGRGSAGGFVTNYLLGITQVDSIKEGIDCYWRFVHRDRPELPDIDLDGQASRKQRVFAALEKYFNSIGGDIYHIATFGTETAKAAIQTATRGLGYDSDIGTYISSLIPIDRGKVRTLQQCYYGDEEKEFNPIPQFIKTMSEYPDIWSVAQRIEGNICRRGVHACGLLPVNGDFIDHNALMKAPNGTLCSQFELHDSEYMGGVKFDALTTDALDRIRSCVDLLLKYDFIEWQGDLKSTYEKYIGMDNLEYDNKEMWSLIGENKISNLFQYDTQVGLATAKLVKPQSAMELAIANSLMRLMADESGIMPSVTYAKYKENIELWYLEMENYGLTKEEQKVMEKHLLANSGVCESQEGIMMISMDEKISNFSIKEANKLRKTIAKKKIAEIETMYKMFFEKGKAAGTSINLLKYVWEVQVKRQLGYSFSVIHSLSYSLIAVQEMNLAYRFPVLFWNCANLIVDSAGMDDEQSFESFLEELEAYNPENTKEEDEEEEEEKKKNKATDYGKISTAIGRMMSMGISISLPDINKSDFTFTPDTDINTIFFGIKGISKINDELAKNIIMNRPYTDIFDFVSKVKLNKPAMVNLIKAGCFDNLKKGNRKEIMQSYIDTISDKKKKLTLQNMAMLIREDCIPEELMFYKQVYSFNKYLQQFKSNEDFVLDGRAFDFYEKKFDMDLINQDKEGQYIIPQKTWAKIYKKTMEPFKEELKTNPKILINLNDKLYDAVWNKYAEGNTSKWEMDSVNFYYGKHELADIDNSRYHISNYNELPEEPRVDKVWTTKDGKEIPIFNLTRICGTVINKDKNKNLVTLLTNDGVVNLKIFRSQFSKYDKQISVKDELTGVKKVIEKSWFSRGNKLMVAGIRRGDTFVPKIYKNHHLFDFPIELIVNINKDGTIEVAGERAE